MWGGSYGKGFSMPSKTKLQLRWNRKSAEQAVTFYTGLIERGIGLTKDEQRDLTMARQFLRRVRRGPVQNSNPSHAKLIYGDVEQIKATKRSGRYSGQKFFHDFKPGAKAYGLDNGDILITTRKLK